MPRQEFATVWTVEAITQQVATAVVGAAAFRSVLVLAHPLLETFLVNGHAPRLRPAARKPTIWSRADITLAVEAD